MKMTFRWYGPDDPVPLQYIRQIPGVAGIVSAIYDVPVGEVWPVEKIAALQKIIQAAGFEFTVIESIPVHEDIKLGRPARDRLIANYCQSVRNMGALGIPILCYNFMPVFDWTRSNLAQPLPDGSQCLSYDDAVLSKVSLDSGTLDLPGWATFYTPEKLKELLNSYSDVTPEKLWENLAYFLKAVVPVAAASGVVMAIHPDDPPWPIFGLPRIVKDEADLDRLLKIVDSPSNGLTFCSGSLGPNARLDPPRLIRKYGGMGRIHFAHCRNIQRDGDKDFHETAHYSACGSLDMYELLRAYHDVGFKSAMRPDHGRMIWGEKGRPGYGLYDRALGAMYLLGIWEALEKGEKG